MVEFFHFQHDRTFERQDRGNMTEKNMPEPHEEELIYDKGDASIVPFDEFNQLYEKLLTERYKFGLAGVIRVVRSLVDELCAAADVAKEVLVLGETVQNMHTIKPFCENVVSVVDELVCAVPICMDYQVRTGLSLLRMCEDADNSSFTV